MTFSQDVVIKVIDTNDAPTSGLISHNTVTENLPKGTEVGTLSAVDPDVIDTHTYKLPGRRRQVQVQDQRQHVYHQRNL